MDYLRHDMSDLRRSTEALAAELRNEMTALGSGLRTEMAALSRDLRGEMAELRASFDRRFTWLVGLVVTGFIVAIGTIAGAFWGVLQFIR